MSRRRALLLRLVRRWMRSRAIRFFRAVSAAEWSDIQLCGRLRQPVGRGFPADMEGKHLWASANHAVQFGRSLRDLGWPDFQIGFIVVEVRFASRANIGLIGLRLDQIGPGYFAEPEALHYSSKPRLVAREP